MNEPIRNLRATFNRLSTDKATRLSHWQDLADYMLPHLAAMTGELTTASRPHATLFDGTGQLAATRFADGLFSHLSPSQFILTAQVGSRLERDRTYTDSLANRTEALQRRMKQGNVETEMYNAYENLGLGNCDVTVRKDPKHAFSLSTRALTEYCFLENEDHAVDTVFVERAYSAYDAAHKWGEGKLPEELQQALREARDTAYSDTKKYLNVQRPNQAWDPTALTVDRYPYTSLWLDLSKDTDEVLEKGGMRRLREIVARLRRPTGLPWGMGPCDMAASWVKALDKMMELSLRYAARVTNPASIWSDEAAFWPHSTNPGTMILGRMGATDRGKPQYLELSGDPRLVQWLFEYCANLVNECFMAQIFQVLRDEKQRTAREVSTILQKDYDMAIPILSRLRSELFGPLVRVCLELLTEYELGTYGWQYGGQPLPEYEYDLELISPLGLAVRYGELQKADNLILSLSPLAQIDPSVWDRYSLDEIGRGIGDAMGVPTIWKMSDSAVRDIRRRRAALVAQRTALAGMQEASQTTKNLSQGMQPNSPLARMVA